MQFHTGSVRQSMNTFHFHLDLIFSLGFWSFDWTQNSNTLKWPSCQPSERLFFSNART